MADVLPWRRLAQPRKAIRLTASALRRGALVVFPGDTGYLAAVSGLSVGAVLRLQDLVGARPLDILVNSPSEASDWLPSLGLAYQRLVSRVWPGPVVLASNEGLSGGLVARLPEPVRAALIRPEEMLHLRMAGHESLLHVRQRLRGPLVVVPLTFGSGKALTGPQAIEASGERVDLLIEDGPALFREPATVVRLHDGTWSIHQAGVLSVDDLRQRLARLIVFVCTGNTCRSPMAEALCRTLLARRLGCTVEELPGRGVLIASAGVHAGEGMPASPEAAEAVAPLGGDLSQHRSQPLTAELIERADHLLAMTRGHLHALRGHLGGLPGHVRLLSPSGEDVNDPIGGPQGLYDACAARLAQHIETFLDEFLKPQPPTTSV